MASFASSSEDMVPVMVMVLVSRPTWMLALVIACRRAMLEPFAPTMRGKLERSERVRNPIWVADFALSIASCIADLALSMLA